MLKFITAIITAIVCSGAPAYCQEPPPEMMPPEFREVQEETKKGDDNFTHNLLQMLTTLGLMIAVLYLGAYVLKRMMNTRIKQVNESSEIQIIEQRSLSTKAILYLIEFHGQELLIGETPQGINVLHSQKASADTEKP